MKTAQVLLVEDEAGDILLTRQVLSESLLPVRLHVARDGEQAVQMLADPEFKPDLIILDLNIPKISGQQFLVQRQSKDIPVVVFSSSWNEAEKQRALQLGARDYIHKPLDIQAFTDAVCGMIQKWAIREEGGAANLASTS